MITLITGAPGAGKSAALVDLLMGMAPGRTIYADGIPDLKVEHQQLADVKQWTSAVPDGSAIVIDEVQRVWRPRGPGQKVPEDVQALETHRHRGLDFFLVTQAPRLLDTNVRSLVGRHIHLRDVGVLGRWWYEWPEVSDALAWKSAPIKKRYKLPKRVFSVYKSASLHIKPVRSFPMMLVVLIAALLVVVGGGWYVARMVAAKVAPPPPPTSAPTPAPGVLVHATGSRPIGVGGAAEMALMFTPRVASDLGSAPAYDGLRTVQAVPRIVGGWCQGGKCRCLTQQHTNAQVPPEVCESWVRERPFDPYRAEAPQNAGVANPTQPGQPGT